MAASELPTYGYTSPFIPHIHLLLMLPSVAFTNSQDFFLIGAIILTHHFNVEMPAHPMHTQNFCGGYNLLSVSLEYTSPSITLNCNTSK